MEKLQRYASRPVAGDLCDCRLINVDRRGQRLTLAWEFSEVGAPGYGLAMLALDFSVGQLGETLGVTLGRRLHCAFKGGVPSPGEMGLWTESALRPFEDQWIVEAALQKPARPRGASAGRHLPLCWRGSCRLGDIGGAVALPYLLAFLAPGTIHSAAALHGGAIVNLLSPALDVLVTFHL